MNVDTAPPALKWQFQKWRYLVYMCMFIGWSCYMLVRKNFPSTMNSLIQHQGFSHRDIGLISSCFAVAYGWSKFAGSVISDHASPRKIFSWGLILAGGCSLVFPLASTVVLACLVWFLEGVVQGCGWPPCVILLKAWYPTTHIGRWWSLLSSAGNIMSAIIPLLVIFINSHSHWSVSYYSFGMITIIVGIAVAFIIKDSPEEIGFKSYNQPAFSGTSSEETTGTGSEETTRAVSEETIETSSEEHTETGSEEGTGTSFQKNTGPDSERTTGAGSANTETVSKETTGTSSQENTGSGSWLKVFFYWELWLVSLMYAFIYFFNHCIINWSQLFLVEREVVPSETRAAACYTAYQVGCIAGNFTSGYLSDLFVTPITSRCPCPRAPLLLGVSIVLVFTFHLFTATLEKDTSDVWVSFLLFVLGYLTTSNVAVIGLTSMEVVPSHLVSSAHGLACALAQIGAFVAGWPFTVMLEWWDWDVAFSVVKMSQVIVVLASVYLLLLLLSAKKKIKTS